MKSLQMILERFNYVSICGVHETKEVIKCPRKKLSIMGLSRKAQPTEVASAVRLIQFPE